LSVYVLLSFAKAPRLNLTVTKEIKASTLTRSSIFVGVKHIAHDAAENRAREPWFACITIKGARKNLGQFATESEVSS
jgi:hypothetical protein